MYKAFNLETNVENDEYYATGFTKYSHNQYLIQSRIDSFILPDKTIDGTKLIAKWFPKIKADVFISHSHGDLKNVLSLAGWLESIFSVNCFIDSCVWGCADDLLLKIDQKYCFDKQRKVFEYENRNYSTSHVHMMLSTALTEMINNCECLIFVNTPNSISLEDVVPGKKTTLSPWIYSEISMTKLIQRKAPEEHRKVPKKIIESAQFSNSGPRVHYDIDMSHLITISLDDLNDLSKNQYNDKYEFLDALYQYE